MHECVPVSWELLSLVDKTFSCRYRPASPKERPGVDIHAACGPHSPFRSVPSVKFSTILYDLAQHQRVVPGSLPLLLCRLICSYRHQANVNRKPAHPWYPLRWEQDPHSAESEAVRFCVAKGLSARCPLHSMSSNLRLPGDVTPSPVGVVAVFPISRYSQFYTRDET